MPAGIQSPSHPTTSQLVPFWRARLAERGLSPATIEHFAITPRGDGWQYPVHPALDATRWKAFDSTATPKYLWLPHKPDAVRFYDVDGTLRDEVAKAGGILWLASGEPDVWALWEGGVRNATCLFDGETRRMPPWFAPELTRLGVRVLHLAPDRDRAGMRFVIQVSRAVSHTPIRVIMHHLPFPPRSKGDVGRLLVKVGAARLRTTLEGLPAYEAVFEPIPPDERPTVVQCPLPHLFPNRGDLYEAWCVEVVEPAAVRAWSISPPDARGFSTNFRCPFHDDRHPSAGWSYETHGIHCFACGYHDAREVAERLGVPSWESYRAGQGAK